MKSYDIDDIIQIGILVTRGGVPQTGKTVYASVYDVDDLGTPLLGSQILMESGDITGFYYYDWSHTLTEKTFSIVVYDVESKRYTEDILVDTSIRDFIDYHDADGDGVAL